MTRMRARGLRGFPGSEEVSDGRVSARGFSWRSQRGSSRLRSTATGTSSAHGQWRPAAGSSGGGGNGARVSRGRNAVRTSRARLKGTDVEGKGQAARLAAGHGRRCSPDASR